MNHPTLDPQFVTALRSELIASVTEAPAVKNHTTRNLIGAAAVALAVAVAIPLGVSMGGLRPDRGVPPVEVTTTSETSHDSGMSRVYIYGSIEELAGDSSLVVKATASSSRSGTLAGAPTDVTTFEVASCFLVGGVVGTEPVFPQHAKTGPDPCQAGDVVEVRTFRDYGIELQEGDTYLLFLTNTGLAEDPSNLYYVTGAVAGAYKEVSGGTYERLVTDVPDAIPLQLHDTDVA